MVDFKTRIEALVAADKLETALREFRTRINERRDELRRELIAHQAALAKTTKERRRGLIRASEEERMRNRVRYAVLELLQDLQEPSDAEAARCSEGALPELDPPAHVQSSSTVFISYSRADRRAAHRIQAALESGGIRVRIDDKDFRAGEDIEESIRRMVAECDAVLSIVSRNSLLSPWVGLETINVFYNEVVKGNRRLIACYLDEEFFNPDFLDFAVGEIDARLLEIERRLRRRAEKKLDSPELSREKSRLYELRNNLGKILDRLMSSLCVDVRETAWSQALPKIIDAIKEK